MAVSNKAAGLRWLLLMAWRDSRRNRSRLLLFGSSIILGIAALVAIYSLGDNLRKNIDLQAAALLGADLEITGGKEATPVVQHIIDSIGGDRSEERSFASMVFFPASQGTRLVQVRALSGAYPYYGKLETIPESAAANFRNIRAALVDQSLMLQYDVKVGDSVMIGTLNFLVAGTLTRAPGQTGLSASVAPVVYIPLQYLQQTGLLQKGSRVSYRTLVKFNRPVDTEKLVAQIESRIEAEGFHYDTIETQKEDTGRSFNDLTQFLELVGFIALLLGCIGVASAIHIYIREKISMIAILRCIGARSMQAFLIFLLQIIGIGTVCAIIGAALGTLIQQLLPLVLQDLLPFEITTYLSWPSIGLGILLGIIISVLFALLPLVSIRNISPLNTLRLSFQQSTSLRDPLKWLVYLLIVAFVYYLMYLQFSDWLEAAIFLGSVALAFLLLAGVALLLMWLVRRFFPVSWSYVWRQGLSNLYRPNNQTLLLIISIGSGTAFICTLLFVQSILINRVTLTASGDQPNIVLFDIQSEQRNAVLSIAQQHGLPIRPTVPIVNMRLEQLNGARAADVQEDTTREQSLRLFSREYRVTYRDTLTPFEKITSGKWQGTVNKNTGAVFISVEKGYAERHDIELGDTLVFNVQGAMVTTYVGSMREVDWNRIQTNFLVVFPAGVLEEAPQFHVLLTRVPSTEASVKFQQQIVKRFPNISIIDLGLVLSIIEELMEKIAFVIRFIAAFSMITGLVVLISSVMISKFQRMQESVLLRTIGASGKQILVITALEYLFLGAMAAATGILLALGASWALAEFSFDTSFTPAWQPVVIIFISICLLTIIIGLLNSRSILNRSPLEVLRQEG